MQDIEDNYEDYKGQISEDTVVENVEESKLLLRDRKVQELFEGYYFDSTQTHRKATKNTIYPTTSNTGGSDVRSRRTVFNWT